MADPMQMLQTLMAANRPMPQSGPTGLDPRAAAITQMMQQMQGAPGSPDLPTPGANRAMQNNPTDSGMQNYMDMWGQERMQNPDGAPEGYVPTPRPRQPDMQPGAMGMEPQDIPDGVDLKESDIHRRGQDGMTDEQELEDLHSKMGKDEEYEWEGKDTPTKNDLAHARAYPTDGVLQDFVDRFGEENLPDDMNNPDAEESYK